MHRLRTIGIVIVVVLTLAGPAAGAGPDERNGRYVSLDEAIAVAMERNYSIISASLDYQEAEVGLRQAEANNLVQPSPVALIQAQYRLDIAKRALELARLDVELEVKERYYGALRTADLAAIAAEAVALAERQLSVAQQRHESGTATRADVLAAENQLAQGLADLAQAEEGYELAVLAFRRTLGLPLSEPVYPDPNVTLAPAAPADLEADIEHALAGRVEILQVQSGIEAASKQVEVVRNDYTPALSLEAAEIALAKVVNQLASARSGIELEIRQLYANLQDAARRVPVLEAAVAKAEEDLRVAQRLYDVNMAPLVQVMAAQVALSKAKSDYTHAIYDLSLAQARYERAVARSAQGDGGDAS